MAKTVLAGVPTGAEALVLTELLAGKRGFTPKTLLHISTSDRSLDMLADALAFFAPGIEVLRFPAWDAMPYDRVSPLPTLMAQRVQTLAALTKPGSRIVLTTASAIVQKLPPREVMQNVVLSLTKGQSIARDELVTYLQNQGYRRNGKAMEPGEFALRGSIIDIVPAGASVGIRIDLFGDDIESMRSYDPLTQLTTPSPHRGEAGRGALLGKPSQESPHPNPPPMGEGITLYPMSEVLLNPAAMERFREQYRELFGAVSKDDPLYEAVSLGAHYPGMEHWLPLFYERVETLFDYLPDALVTLDYDTPAAIAEREESIRDYYDARVTALASRSKNLGSGAVYNPVPPERAFLIGDAWNTALTRREHALFSPFLPSPSPLAGEGGVGGTRNITNVDVVAAPPHPNPPPQGGRELRVNYRPAIRFTQGQADHTPFDQLKERQASGKPILIACYSQGSRERLQTLLMERGFHCVTVERWQELSPSPLEGEGRGGGHSGKRPLPLTPSLKGRGNIYLALLPLENGFETDTLLILSEQDILGERIARIRPRKKKSDVFLAEAANFAEGELVVHKEHGIGRFEGLVTLTVSGAAHDCLKLVYEGDDKLFLPVENIELVSRFGLEEEGVKLDKLGGASWQARTAKLKQRIKIAAEALLKTAAERLMKKGAVIDTPVGTYDDFCARFPYVETEDQARAIEDVLADLHSGKPMDRLICGDVGFGKTEVAMRAAFVVSALSLWERDGDSRGEGPHPSPLPKGEGIRYQVALVCPTTLLARQHYRNFKQRFEGFPVTVRQLSRMVPAKQQKETRDGLAEGKVDIVIGTHALLAKQVSFKNLGLVIVDEEQHFGVAQKEKLKELKSDVHVLTLSATPIPRTLQMALTGVRDLSLITTPPIDRLAVRSFVMPFDPVVVKEALLREIHRGGKCFVVTPRIKDMAEVKTALMELVPEARIAVAHGQMAAGGLDDIMNDFYDGKYDILLSTAIIESGLDIPTANTMIIHNAHLFGLSQLYQLRGRVGRGKIRAYAYFLLPHHQLLSNNATRRLEVMQTLDTLGAGFTLASHDMDIRGFGNLVGEEQSGHIREVGIELYQQMLEEAVAALKDDRSQMTDGKKESHLSSVICHPSSDWSPQINLGISVLIPESYVGDLQLRLGLYRRVADMDNEADIESFAAELIDRFGDMPEEVRHLIAVLSLKILCRRAGIERLDVGPKGAVIGFRGNVFAKPDALLAYVDKHIRTLKVRPDMKLVFTHEWKDAGDKLATLKKLVGEIAGLVGN